MSFSADPRPPDPRRWLALVFIGLAQLMIVLDVTIVNIALPSLQTDLGISDGDRQWVITGYTLAFGSLLFLGGRIADYTGRKRAFLIALIGFAAASALGGMAGNFELLLASRVLQGLFGALLAPATLSLIAVTFTDGRERAKAFGIFGAIAAGGGAIGLILGGALTDYLDWRWCLYVNIPVALVAAVGGYLVLSDARPEGHARFDFLGVLLVSGGLVSIVYACSEAESEGWGSTLVVGLFAIGAALLAAFVAVESKISQPLLPLRVLASRTRGGAYLAVAVAVVGLFGAFLFNTYYMQVVLGYSPVKTGVAFLPMSVAVLVAAGGISSRLMLKLPPRLLIVPGLLFGAAGMAWTATLEATTGYAQGVMTAQLLLGFGMGLIMPVAMDYSTYGIAPEDAGVASAGVNTSQQVGGSIGTALLNTIAASAAADYLVSHPKSPTLAKEAMTEGFGTAGSWAAAIMLVGAVVVALLMNTPRPARNADKSAAVPAPAHL
ncbi:MFS transporter [Spirillospora sp. CA-294931]|uniref:MFS transporter n=1 Tax=Spirillospora sp. CA-294931 TaxID=3240042 RepID=UPI003D90F6CF